jgi:UDP-2,4-diacetamido-2,4,6-trideoxy-beta-L-altropyranose hydrolase
MHKPKIIFRADGNTQIGMGHIFRCLALADMLKDEFDCNFYVQEPMEYLKKKVKACGFGMLELPSAHLENEASELPVNEDDIVVLDGYQFSSHYQRVIKATGCKLVCIDDLAELFIEADIVINHNPYLECEYSTALYTRVYQGVKYALVNPVFSQYKTEKAVDDIRSVFICFGGSDSKNITFKAVEACLNAGIESIYVVTGSAYLYLDEFVSRFQGISNIYHKHIAEPWEIATYIAKSDLAICPASNISYEVAIVGSPMLTGYYADNQKYIEKFLVAEGCATSVGDFNTVDVHSLTDYIRNAKKSVEFQLTNQKRVFTASQTNIRKVFNKLSLEKKLLVREAREDDVDLYFTWANDFAVRNNAIKQEPIKYSDHVEWFMSKMSNAKSKLYLVELSGTPIGQVRYDAMDDGWVIDYSVAKEYRGRGLAGLILSSTIYKLMRSKHEVECLKATVLEENISSIRVFNRLGFKNTTKEIINQRTYINLSKCIPLN